MTSAKALARFTSRQRLFSVLCALAVLVSWPSLKALVELSLHDERYTYILVIPIISAFFLYSEADRICRDARYCPATGVPLMLLGFVLLFLSRMRLSFSESLTIAAGAMVLLWIGAFILCYGATSFRNARFPLLFLLLIVPIPSAILDRAVAWLQVGSAELAYLLFRVTGVPILKHGMVMSLPGVDIEVAPQCSGIRSTMALFLAGAVLSRLLLRTGWAGLVTILCIGPIGMFRNAVRIVCISLLGVYVDRGFLVGNLHHRGGLLFSLVGFAVLIPLVCLLRRCERFLRFGRMIVGGSGAGL